VLKVPLNPIQSILVSLNNASLPSKLSLPSTSVACMTGPFLPVGVAFDDDAFCFWVLSLVVTEDQTLCVVYRMALKK